MKQLLIIFCFFLVYSNLMACKEERPVQARSSVQEQTVVPVLRIIQFSARLSEQKVLLSWTVDQNQQADYFEIEKTTDNVNYTPAGMVFPGEGTGTEQYPFKEPCTNKNTRYRIKVILKNKEITYSETISLTTEK